MSRNQWLVIVGVIVAICLIATLCVSLVGGVALMDQLGLFQQLGQAPGQPEQPSQPSGRPTAAAEQPTSPPAPRAVRDTLRLPGAEPATLDPALVTDVTSAEYIFEIFSGLVTFDQELNIIPDIARDWEVSEDGLTYTFHLRDDVKFHDGKPVSAQDFKWTIERACDPATISPVASLYLNDVVGCTDKLDGRGDEVTGLQVIDDLTLEITIDAPKAYFLAKLTYPTAFVLDQENVESGGRTWTDHPNGTGPFKLAEYRLGERIVLERNALYYGEPKPGVARVDFTLAGGSAMIMYENGELDATPVPISDLERVLDPSNPLNAELSVTDPTLSIFYVGFNTKVPPFDDVKVRQAFNHAVDKELLTNVVWRKTRLPSKGILPPGMPGYNEDLDGLEFDPEKARQLIAESRYGSVENLPEINVSVSGGGAAADPVTTALIGMFEQNLGIQVGVELVESATFLSDVTERRFQMFLLGWSADYPDPQDFLDILFHSESFDNHTNYSNPEADRLLEEARVEQDHEKRMALYQQAEQIIVNDAPWIPLYYSAEYWLTKPYVKGMMYPPAVIPKLKYVTLER